MSIEPIAVAATTGAMSLLAWVLNSAWSGRQERVSRQREEFSKAFVAYVAYKEFPYVVRRRRADNPEVERNRISSELTDVQKQLAYYSAWLATESRLVSRAYARLLEALRAVAGSQMREAWRSPPTNSDEGMNMPDLGLSLLEPYEEEYLTTVADHLSVIPAWTHRRARWLVCQLRRNPTLPLRPDRASVTVPKREGRSS